MVFINVSGQEGSRNLMAEYCANNWKSDPVHCASYIHSGVQTQSSQAISQTPSQSNPTNDEDRICPYGSYLGKDAFGNQACLDSHTNQVVGSPNPGQSSHSSNPVGSTDSGTLAAIVVFIVIILIIVGITKSRGKSKKYKSLPRRGWSDSERKQILGKTGGRCAMCGEYSGSYQFDHKDGNRSNNNLRNGQALCPNCHDRKSRGLN